MTQYDSVAHVVGRSRDKMMRTCGYLQSLHGGETLVSYTGGVDTVHLHIGMDDTDSVRGMCTTYLGFVIAEGLIRRGATFLDYPRLVRLNPNVPWKTRGNGAVSLEVSVDDPSDTCEYVIRMVEKYADLKHGANPGVVFVEGVRVPPALSRIAANALYDIVNIQDVQRIAQKLQIRYHTMGSGQGMVGALAAIGYEFGDSTPELITYRMPSMCGEPRVVDPLSVRTMQEATYPYTFGSYDYASKRVLITPRGPDPVFYGLRGEDPRILHNVKDMISHSENLLGHMIFRTNQGTGDHLSRPLNVSTLMPHSSGFLRGKVYGTPQAGRGGHAYFAVKSDDNVVSCAMYKPTGLAGLVSLLVSGDVVTVGGGVRAEKPGFSNILNVEDICIERLTRIYARQNPRCDPCNKNMKSQGRGQGYRCMRCGSTANSFRTLEVHRDIHTGHYLPLPGSQRHLTRPEQRWGRTNDIKFDGKLPWFLVY